MGVSTTNNFGQMELGAAVVAPVAPEDFYEAVLDVRGFPAWAPSVRRVGGLSGEGRAGMLSEGEVSFLGFTTKVLSDWRGRGRGARRGGKGRNALRVGGLVPRLHEEGPERVGGGGEPVPAALVVRRAGRGLRRGLERGRGGGRPGLRRVPGRGGRCGAAGRSRAAAGAS